MNSMEKEENNFGAFALAAGSSSFPVAGLASPVPSGAGGDAAAAFVPPHASLQGVPSSCCDLLVVWMWCCPFYSSLYDPCYLNPRVE